MLDDARQPALSLDLRGLAIPVQSLHLYGRVAFHLTHQIRDGETTFHAQQSLFRSLDDLWIQHCPNLFGSIFLVFILFIFKVLDHDDTLREPDLRRGETNAGSKAHGFDHVVYQGLEILVKFCYCVCLAFQYRVRECDDLTRSHSLIYTFDEEVSSPIGEGLGEGDFTRVSDSFWSLRSRIPRRCDDRLPAILPYVHALRKQRPRFSLQCAPCGGGQCQIELRQGLSHLRTQIWNRPQ